MGADSVGIKGAAFVESDLESGSLVLRGSGGDFTLLWEAEGSEPRRGLEAGEYRLRGARIERMKENEHWFLSSTHTEGKAHRLVRGKSTRIDIDSGVRVAASLKRKGSTLHLGLNISGRDGRNLTIYRADKRVPAGYRILNGAGEIVAEGAMNYG